MKYESTLAIVRAIESAERTADMFRAISDLKDVASLHLINAVRSGNDIGETAERWRGILEALQQNGA